MTKLVVLSGCSGGGKTTLLEALQARGYAGVAEPGRRVIADQEPCGGDALPWANRAAFAEAALQMARRDLARWQQSEEWVFVDRGVIDAASALASLTGKPLAAYLVGIPRYHRTVFLTPPWPEIFVRDDQRRHDQAAAIQEYDRLLDAYPEAGYDTMILPKVSVQQRVDEVLRVLLDQ